MDGATSSDFSVLPKSSCPINGMVERFNRRLGEHLDRLPQNRAAHLSGISTYETDWLS